MLNRIIANIKTNGVRHDSMQGRDYLVVPMVMLTEGVHNGSGGPLLYTEDELAKAPAVWNTKPVVVYHPERDGRGVSACDPTVLTQHSIGVIMNTVYKKGRGKNAVGKLHAEAWIEVERANEVDGRILPSIEEGKMQELSTGLFNEVDKADGEWRGEAYTGVVKNILPDHLAILPDKKGACSIADGAGFLRLNAEVRVPRVLRTRVNRTIAEAYDDSGVTVNGMSYGAITSALGTAVRAAYGGEKVYCWIEDVYDGHFIYSKEGPEKNILYTHKYTVDDTEVALVGEPEEVERYVDYRKVGKTTNNSTPKENVMSKKDLVDALIANTATQWAEADRDTLMALDEKALEKMTPVALKKEETKTDPAPVGNATPTQNAAPVTPPASPKQTFNEILATADQETQDALLEMQQVRNEERARLTKLITDNTANTFTAEQLGKKSLADLRAIAALAAPAGAADAAPRPNYAGAAAPLGNAAPAHKGTPLAVPTMNFDKAKA